MAATLWYYAKAHPDIAKIVFASIKIEVATTYIEQLAAATDASTRKQKDLEHIFQQLGQINGVRNYIVHYGTIWVAEGRGLKINLILVVTQDH